MEGLYQNKYRIKSARLKGWDYGADAYYFVTICIDAREHYFGRIMRDNGGDASVALSEIGKIARDCYLEIPKHFEYVNLDAFIIMPNHIHGLIQICKHPQKRDDKNVIIAGDNKQSKSVSNPCGRDEALPRLYGDGERRTYIGKHPNMSKISPKPKTLPVIIGSFKSIVTKKCNQQNLNFKWQTRYYDSIVRNEETLNRVREYIKNNPKMWYRDRNNLQGIFM